MKYSDTTFHGTKKDLREYLARVKNKAFQNVTKEFEPKLKACQKEIEDELGVTEYYENSVPVIKKELDKLLNLLDAAGDIGVYASGYGLIGLSRNSDNLVDSIQSNIGIASSSKYSALMRERETALNELKKAWQDVNLGIVGKNQRVKYTCRDLEEIGFDLTPYYEYQFKNEQVHTPAVTINYSDLGIK